MTAAGFSLKFKMPSIYRPNNESVFRCKVGYFLDPLGRRKRREFRLGSDQLAAHKKALKIAEDWREEVARHDRLSEQYRGSALDDGRALPVWTGLPPQEKAAREAYLAEPPEDLPGDELTAAPRPTLTVTQAANAALERIEAKVKRDAKSQGTYSWYENQFEHGLVNPAIDPDLPVVCICLEHIEKYCDYWCDLANRSKESTRGTFSAQSAKNRMNAFSFLLNDLVGRVPGYIYPERAEQTFTDNKQTVAGTQPAIFAYDPDPIRKLLGKADDRMRLWIYCALNFGMLQADIGQQIRRRHSPEFGGLIEIDGERYLQWERYKLKRRQRALKRENDQDKPVLLTHYIWPETLKLLTKFAAPEGNEANLWLLNGNGNPLYAQKPDQKRAVDNISTNYNRLKHKLKVDLPFEQFRKFGGTAAERLGSRDVQELYRGERRQGSSKRYVLGDFTGKLTYFLKGWADLLRKDRVLF